MINRKEESGDLNNGCLSPKLLLFPGFHSEDSERAYAFEAEMEMCFTNPVNYLLEPPWPLSKMCNSLI